MKIKLLFLIAALVLVGCTPTKEPICNGSVVRGCQPVVYFDFNSSEIDDEAKKNLGWVVTKLKRWSAKYVDITGHTDEVGSHDANMKLSKKRADAIKDYLVAEGIDPKRISTSFKGETKQICTNSSCQDVNRRAEIYIYTHHNDGLWNVIKGCFTNK